MAEQDLEKTEQATPKRQQEAREKGQVARSREIPSVAVLMAGTAVLYFLFPRIYSNLLDLTSNIFSTSWSIELSETNIYPLWVGVLKGIFFTMLPFLLIIALAGAAANILQFGFIFTTQAFEFKLSRISPLEGVKRLISIHSSAELVKAILKIIIVSYTAYLLIRREFYNFPLLVDADINYILSYTGRLTLRLIIWTGAALTVLAGIDFGFQKWKHVKSLRMTRQEVNEEFKQQEGNPVIKARIRSLQREMAKKRMMAEVPKADVVITNPTHLAVALSYKH
ncbi:MAG: flagellar biosynthesis protein FlhB [Nitrospirae bacterium]|nr:flagellar biosynthesis protein FlhB [Nitrospirota bacterium]